MATQQATPGGYKEPTGETCYICDRVKWGNWLYLGKGLWRHAECLPGSVNWKEYARKTKRETDASTILLGEGEKT